jgi:hypothetical protein
MDQTRESGGTRARAIPTLDARDLTIRLLLAERAIAEQAARMAELTAALAGLTGIEAPSATGQSIVVDADAVSPLALGFYHREFDKLGRPFRWTGKSDLFEFRVRLNRNAAWAFELELQANPNVEMKKLRGFVDYIEIPVEVGDANKTVSGIIPERIFGATATVSFLLPNTYVPSIINPDVQDNRTLGLIFYELRARALDAMPVAGAGSRNGAEAVHDEARGAALVGRRHTSLAAADPAETTS